MKRQILMTGIEIPLGESGDSMANFSFDALKKTLFGGVKVDHKYDSLTFMLNENDDIEIDSALIFDRNLNHRKPTTIEERELVYGVMHSVLLKLTEDGDKLRAEKVNLAIRQYWKKYFNS